MFILPIAYMMIKTLTNSFGIFQCSVLEATSARLVREGGLKVLVTLLAREGQSYVDALVEKDPSFARESGLTGEPPGPPRSRKVSKHYTYNIIYIIQPD